MLSTLFHQAVIGQLDPVELVEGQEAAVLSGLLAFFLTLVVVYGVARFILLRRVIRAFERRQVEPSIVSLARLVGQVGSLILAFGLAFAVAGFGSFLTAISAVSGALVIAIGLAADDIISNLLAGMYIINEKLFEVDDWIEWEDYRGRVERIDLRVTRLRTFDNELITVPNSVLANSVLTNPVAYDRLRISVQFNVGYSDVDQAIDVILTESEAFSEILAEPAPSVRIAELTETSVGLKARVWMGTPSRSDFNRLRTSYVTNVLARLVAEGIEPDPAQVQLSGGIGLEYTEPT